MPLTSACGSAWMCVHYTGKGKKMRKVALQHSVARLAWKYLCGQSCLSAGSKQATLPLQWPPNLSRTRSSIYLHGYQCRATPWQWAAEAQDARTEDWCLHSFALQFWFVYEWSTLLHASIHWFTWLCQGVCTWVHATNASMWLGPKANFLTLELFQPI